MNIVLDQWLEEVDKVVGFKNKRVIEIGSGDGYRTAQMALLCDSLTGFEIDTEKVQIARLRNLRNVCVLNADITNCPLFEDECDISIFTLSFHHLDPTAMMPVISRIVRSTRKNGYVVFLEPGIIGTIFQAEILFDAWDGDERKQKEIAYQMMTSSKELQHVIAFNGQTSITFPDKQDFIDTLKPKKNLHLLDGFLAHNNLTLWGERRINIFQPIK